MRYSLDWKICRHYRAGQRPQDGYYIWLRRIHAMLEVRRPDAPFAEGYQYAQYAIQRLEWMYPVKKR